MAQLKEYTTDWVNVDLSSAHTNRRINMKTFKLLPIDGRKTLSNQHVNQYTVDGEEWSDLISYSTRVAAYNHTTNEMSVYSCQSNTTARHINAFLSFYGFDTCTKKELQNYK